MTMRGYLFVASVYLAGAVLVIWTRSVDLGQTLVATAAAAGTYAGTLAYSGAWAAPLLVVVAWTVGREAVMQRMAQVGYAFAGCLALQVAFSFMKTSIPEIVPFYADPALAAADRWLHGGEDPWRAAHALVRDWPIGAILPAYVQVWTYPATALPVFVALTDGDRARVSRFLVLYLGIWIGLGTIGALAGSSVGPVYYDSLLGGDRFAALTEVLRQSPINGSLLGTIQEVLWQNYVTGAHGLGLGISAFPSVHVAIAVLTAIYLAERVPVLAPVGLVWVALIQFLSVYTGYHYALDGYVSIALVALGWTLLRRARRRDFEPMPAE